MPTARHPKSIMTPSSTIPMLKSMIAAGIPMIIQKAAFHTNPRTENIPLKIRAIRKIDMIAISIAKLLLSYRNLHLFRIVLCY